MSGRWRTESSSADTQLLMVVDDGRDRTHRVAVAMVRAHTLTRRTSSSSAAVAALSLPSSELNVVELSSENSAMLFWSSGRLFKRLSSRGSEEGKSRSLGSPKKKERFQKGNPAPLPRRRCQRRHRGDVGAAPTSRPLVGAAAARRRRR